MCNRNAELLRLLGTTFDSKVPFVRTMIKKNLIILKSLQKKILAFFVSFVCRCWHLSCQISIESVRKIVIGSPNVLYTDSAVFKIFLNIIAICVFIEQLLIEILNEILFSIMASIVIYAIKVPVWTPYKYPKETAKWCQCNYFLLLVCLE